MNKRMVLCLVFGIATTFAGQQSQDKQQSRPSDSTALTPAEKQAYEADIQLMREDIRSERKRIVAENLPLTTAEATKFWPLYEQYIAETIKINDGRYALIKEYTETRDTMTDAQADSFITRWISLDKDNTQLRLKYIPQFQKVISHRKTAMFFQIDRRLGMLIELKVASQVPLVKP